MDRDNVWAVIKKHHGNRDKAAEALNCSVRTLNRWIQRMNLYPELDKAGFIRNPGPPRGVERGVSLVTPLIKAHVKKHKGQIDYGDLAIEVYGEDSQVTRQRIYTCLSGMKSAGEIAVDGSRWFLINQP